MNKPTLIVDTPCAGPVILEPLPNAHVRLHWTGDLSEPEANETWQERLLHSYSADWLLAEGFIAFAAGQIQPDHDIINFLAGIDA